MNAIKYSRTALLLTLAFGWASNTFGQPSYSITDLGTLPGEYYSEAYGLNNSGQVVGISFEGGNGISAFLYSDGVMSDLGTLGGYLSYAYGINNGGQVVGISGTAGYAAAHAFLCSAGVMSDLGTFGGSYNGVGSEANGINNSGQVVGYTYTGGGLERAFIYAGGVMIDLNTLILTNSGWTLDEATAINDNGQIVGYGLNPEGITHAFLLTPSPPSITSQPQSIIANAHATVTFNVSAIALSPLEYQWSLNGTNITGATASYPTISNVTQTNLGVYAVVVSNASGAITSSNATLSMYPFIASPFAGLDTFWGFTNTLSVTAWGTGPLIYQWFDNGVAIADATNQTLTLADIQFTNAGLYSVVVTSPLGSITNIPAQVVVNPANVSLGLFPGVYIGGVVGNNYIIQSNPALTNTNGWATVATVTF